MRSRNIPSIAEESFTTEEAAAEEATLETGPIATAEEAVLETGPIAATEEAALETGPIAATEEVVPYSKQIIATGEMVSNTKLEEFVRWIVEKGSLAYFEIINEQANINIHNYNGETVLHKLVELNDLDAIGLILQDSEEYDKAITLLSKEKHSNLNLYKIDINAVALSQRNEMITALDLAESKGNKEIEALLCRHGAKKRTQLHEVVEDKVLRDYATQITFNPFEMYLKILVGRENINIYNVNGETILHKLVMRNGFDAIELILQDGDLYKIICADLHLSYPVTQDYYNFFKIDINAVSNCGTVLDLAILHNRTKIAELLLKHGAKRETELYNSNTHVANIVRRRREGCEENKDDGRSV